MRESRFFKNTSWLLFGNIFRMIFQLVVNLLIARHLGPERQGVVNYVAAYTAFFTSLVSLGISGVLIHELVNNPEEEGKILGSSLYLRFVASVFSMISMLGILYLTDSNDRTIMWIAFLQAIQLPFASFDTVKYWYQKNQQSWYAVYVTTAGYVLSSIYKVYIIITDKNILWFAFASSLDIVLIGLLYLFLFFIQGGTKLHTDKNIVIRLLKSCVPFAFAEVMAIVYSRIDTVMIRHMMGSMEMVGFYTTAVAICGYVSFVPTALLDAARPIIMDAKKKDENIYRKRMRQSNLVVIFVAILYAFIVTFFGSFIIRLLYGEAFMGSLNSVRIAVWYTVFAFLGAVKNIWLICEKLNKYVVVFSVMGTVTNIVLNAILIPIFGIEGAAVATLITHMVTNVIYPILFSETRGFVINVIEAALLKNVNFKETIQLVLKK